MPVVHQCWVCGKRHKTLEAAEKCHDGPVQSIQTHVKREVYRAPWGNAFRKAKK
jgi:hypothetical protein